MYLCTSTEPPSPQFWCWLEHQYLLFLSHVECFQKLRRQPAQVSPKDLRQRWHLLQFDFLSFLVLFFFESEIILFHCQELN